MQQPGLHPPPQAGGGFLIAVALVNKNWTQKPKN